MVLTTTMFWALSMLVTLSRKMVRSRSAKFSLARLPETAYIRENFPDIGTPAAKVRILEKAGYVPLAHFVLPQHCWTQNYYAAVAARIPDFLEEQGHSPAAVRMAALMREEIEHYCAHGTDYGYVFYIGQKPEK